MARTAILLLATLHGSVWAACAPDPIFMTFDNCTINLPNEPAIQSRGFLLSVGASESSKVLQYLCGVPSTVTNSVFYTTSLLCSQANLDAQNLTYAQCRNRRAGGLEVDDSGKPSPATGADALQTTSTSGFNKTDSGWATIMKPDDPFPAAVLATLHLHGHDSVTMTAGLIEAGTNHTASHISLGDQSVLLASLVAAGRILHRAFGFDAGSQSYWAPRPGGLALGGVDEGARAGTEVRFDMTYNRIIGSRFCPLQVNITSMALRPAGGDGSSDYQLSIEPSHPQLACLEMYDNYPRMPRSVLKDVQDGFALFTGSNDKPIPYAPVKPTAPPSNNPLMRQLEEIYIPEPGLIYPYNNLTALFNASLVIKLDHDFTVEIPLEELYNPLRGIARDGTRVVNTNFTELAFYQDAAPEDAAVLGKVFLSRAYLYVDYDNNYFTLTPSANSGKTILEATGGDGSEACVSGSGSRWNAVTIALVAVVAFLGLVSLLLAAGALLLAKKYRLRWRSLWPWRREELVASPTPKTGTVITELGDPKLPPARDEPHQSKSDATGQIHVASAAVRQQEPSIETSTEAVRRGTVVSELSMEMEGTSVADPPTYAGGRRPELQGQEVSRSELESPTAGGSRRRGSDVIELHSLPSTSTADPRPSGKSRTTSSSASGNGHRGSWMRSDRSGSGVTRT